MKSAPAADRLKIKIRVHETTDPVKAPLHDRWSSGAFPAKTVLMLGQRNPTYDKKVNKTEYVVDSNHPKRQ